MNEIVWDFYQNGPLSGILHTLVYCLKQELKDCHSVLDLGCGSESPIKYFDMAYSTGVDTFEPYIKKSKEKKIHNQYILEDITKVKFKPRSYDAVILIDVLEHLKKNQGKQLLKKAEIWARKKIIIYTPNGFLPQGEINQNPLQSHQSGWEIKELQRRGYRAYGMAGWKFLWKVRKKRNLTFVDMRFYPRFFWLVISVFTQLLTYYFPKLAFEIFYVKNLHK